jgi:hypothetical protein
MSGKAQDGEGFLSRWSRRKRENHPAADEVEDAVLTPVEAVEGSEGARPEGQDGPAEDPELVANREAAEAVDLESLTYESDFTVFMKRGVPDALKNAALRKLWRSNPDLAVLDGLNDYDTDFRTAETAMGGFRSAWKVGRGYADKAEEVRAEMEARSVGADEERPIVEGEDAQTAQQDVVPDEGVPGALEEGATVDTGGAQAESEDGEPERAVVEDDTGSVPRVPRRRRMAFDVET